MSPGFRRGWSREFLELTGSGASFDDGAWSGELQGLFAASLRDPGRSGAELLAGVGASTARQTPGTSQGWMRGRWHALTGRTDLWGGFGLGLVHTDSGQRALRTAEAGIGWATGRWRLLSNGGVTAVSDDTRWAEWSGTIQRAGPVTATLSAGFRQQWDPLVNDVGWVAGSLETPVPPLGSLVLAAGTYPADLAQGFASGRYVSLTLRLGGGRTGGAAPPRTTKPDPALRAWGVTRFDARVLGQGRVRFTVRAPNASLVEITGDFTDWTPVALTRQGQGWSVTLTVPPGVHQMGLRLNGGAWRAPPGTTRSQDEFGGEVGLLVVE